MRFTKLYSQRLDFWPGGSERAERMYTQYMTEEERVSNNAQNSIAKSISRGFTLIEVMVVVVILGILAAMVVPKIMSRPDQAKIVKAQQDVTAIQSALDLYKLDNGFYPTTDQGLQALVTKPDSNPVPQSWKSGGYLQTLPVDPWGKPYQYLNPGVHGDIDIFSYGPSGKAGAGEIGNWNGNNQGSAGNNAG